MNPQSLNIKEIRDVANSFDTGSIESCLQLAMENQDNPCYENVELEEVMNVLAKANFVRGQVEQGITIAVAMRELGKRIRTLQNNIPSAIKGEG